MTTNRKRHSKSEFVLFQNFIDLIHHHLICQQCSRYFLGLNPKGPYLSLEKEKGNFCVVFTYSFKPVREIRRFHVAVVQRRLRNVQKSVMHVQSCCFVNINLLLFYRSRRRRCRRCLGSVLLWSRNFATMVAWRRTSLDCLLWANDRVYRINHVKSFHKSI